MVKNASYAALLVLCASNAPARTVRSVRIAAPLKLMAETAAALGAQPRAIPCEYDWGWGPDGFGWQNNPTIPAPSQNQDSGGGDGGSSSGSSGSDDDERPRGEPGYCHWDGDRCINWNRTSPVEQESYCRSNPGSAACMSRSQQEQEEEEARRRRR